MAQKKAHEVDAWLLRRDPGKRVVLLYGPDRGLVSERARRVVASTGLAADDPFSVVRLEATEIEQTPGRLIDEARTVPMFSDSRLIWVRNAGAQKALAEDVKILSGQPPLDAVILVEAGDLKKGAPLRTIVEASEHAMALPCYADDGRAVDSLIDEELQEAGLMIGLEARQALKRSLGGDRLASRGELEKLVLYAAGRAQVTLDDVKLLAGDVSGLSIDDIIDAALEGDMTGFDRAFSRLCASSNQAAGQALASALRQFQALQLMRAAIESGSSATSVVASARPPIFFGRRKIIENALTTWNGQSIVRALGALQNAVLQARKRSDLAEPIARYALLAIVAESARSRHGNR